MKARIPQHREFIINFPDTVDNAKANEGWAKLQQIVEDYKKDHNGASVYAPSSSRTASLPSRNCRKSTVSSTPLSTSSNFCVFSILHEKEQSVWPAGWSALLFVLFQVLRQIP